ncbi:MAG: hypothetical protein ACRDJW_18370 [Thermomicrobiales bacterium]
MVMERVNIAVADDYLDHFSEVVSDAERAGLQVEQELEALGIVSGVIEYTRLAGLYRVKGIATVDQERRYQLPPPESVVQ